MSNEFCECEDMDLLLKKHGVFVYNDDYGWVLSWISLDKENGKFNRVNKYGVVVSFCPICGKKLKK